MAGASVSEMARDIVVALIQSGKIQLDANAKKQGEWLGDLFKAVHQRIVVQSAIEVLVEDQLKNFDLEDLRQLRELLDAEIAARS
jgi:predicted HTH domain antitoxin